MKMDNKGGRMRLLVIEDNTELRAALERTLKGFYVVDAVSSGLDGLQTAQTGSYDLVILDLGLPGLDGLGVCKNLRTAGITTPILVLTAQDDTHDKVALLDAGADDYMTKPFAMEELLARLRALARREPTTGSSPLQIGPLVLDPASRTVTRSGRPIPMRRKEFDLLEYLMRNHDRVVTRVMITDHVWEADEVLWTNAIDVHVKYLRDKIDRPFNEALIKTIHGVGYKLETPKSAETEHPAVPSGH